MNRREALEAMAALTVTSVAGGTAGAQSPAASPAVVITEPAWMG